MVKATKPHPVHPKIAAIQAKLLGLTEKFREHEHKILRLQNEYSQKLAGALHEAVPSVLPYFLTMVAPGDYEPQRVPDGISGDSACLPDRIIRDVKDFSYGVSTSVNTSGSASDPWYGKYMTNGANGIPDEMLVVQFPTSHYAYALSLRDPVQIATPTVGAYPDYVGTLTSDYDPDSTTRPVRFRAVGTPGENKNGSGTLWAQTPLVISNHILFPVNAADGSTYYQISGCSCAADLSTGLVDVLTVGMNLSVIPGFIGSGPAPLAFDFNSTAVCEYLDNGGVWQPFTQSATLFQSGLSINCSMIASAAQGTLFKALRFSALMPGDRAGLQLSVTFFPRAYTLSTPARYCSLAIDACVNNMTFYHTPRLSKLTEVQKERPAALSGLHSCLASELVNGGFFTMARVPLGTSLGAISQPRVIDWIASLPRDSMNGALKFGGYGFWLPESEQEYNYQPYGSSALATVSFLVAAYQVDDPSTSMRFEGHQNIEMLTTNTVYGCALSPVSPFFSYQLMKLRETIPNVTCNPAHKKLGAWIKGMFSKIGRVLKNPKTWQTAASIAPLIGKAVAML